MPNYKGRQGAFYLGSLTLETAYSTYSAVYAALFNSGQDSNGLNGTEAPAQTVIDFDFTLIRIDAYLGANTNNVATTIGFRDDAATVGSISLTASTTGNFNSGALSVSVVKGSKCAILLDTSGSSTGSFYMRVSAFFGKS